jgi:hexosaminidase
MGKSSYKGKTLNLIPLPKNLDYQSEKGFTIGKKQLIIFSEQLKEEASLLSEYLKEMGIESESKMGNKPEDSSIFLQLGIGPDSSEAYKIVCTEKQFMIMAPSRLGILHGIQTLRQVLLREYEGKTIQLPAFEISDAPRFRWRGMLLDCSRHFMDKAFVKRYIDLLALHKMNRFHWHLTEDQGWRIEIKKYPLLTQKGAWRSDGKGGRYGGFYTQEDIKEVVAYATARGIMVIPEIELPGHAQAALAAYPQFSCTGGPFEVETEWGVFKEIYCAGNDNTFTFLEDVLTEVLALFPAPYIHIGGDEVPKFRWEHCDKCQKRMKDKALKDEHELQSYFIGRINSFLQSKGRRLLGWDEILEGGLVPGAVVQSWRGFDGAMAAVKQGHPTIVSPTSHAYFDYGLNDIDLKKVYEFNPIPKGSSNKEAALVWGGECNMWTERAPQETVDSKVFPRILAMSEVLWSAPKKRNFEAFSQRVAKHYACLDRLGVKYGMERIPIQIKTSADNGKLKVVLESDDKNLTTRYRLGKAEEKTYKEAFVIEKPEHLDIRFERAGKAIDFSLSQSLYPHKALGLKPQIIHEVSEQYAGNVLDGKKGSSNFKDGNWQGTFGYNMIFFLDLGKMTEIQQLSAGFLQYNNAWIFFPKKVEFLGSNDGKNFQSLGMVSTKIDPKEKEQMTQEFQLRFASQKVRYIKIKAFSIGRCPDWHDAAGSKSWLFMDELAVE